IERRLLIDPSSPRGRGLAVSGSQVDHTRAAPPRLSVGTVDRTGCPIPAGLIGPRPLRQERSSLLRSYQHIAERLPCWGWRAPTLVPTSRDRNGHGGPSPVALASIPDDPDLRVRVAVPLEAFLEDLVHHRLASLDDDEGRYGAGPGFERAWVLWRDRR